MCFLRLQCSLSRVVTVNLAYWCHSRTPALRVLQNAKSVFWGQISDENCSDLIDRNVGHWGFTYSFSRLKSFWFAWICYTVFLMYFHFCIYYFTVRYKASTATRLLKTDVSTEEIWIFHWVSLWKMTSRNTNFEGHLGHSSWDIWLSWFMQW